jgi:sensor domain CHASE-containing protein/nitrogen-specific signal transduction histidine kinase
MAGETMGIRKRTLTIICILAVTMMVAAYYFSNSLLLNSFRALEETDVRQNIGRFQSALSNDISDLYSKAGDWAVWDDTYAFVVNLNEDYIKSNIVDSAFTTLKINILLIVNVSGQIVCGRAYDLHNMTEVPVPQSIENELSSHDILWRFSTTDSKINGIILLPENPLLICSRPILTSQGQGPIHGALIMARYLDSDEIQQLAQTTNLSLVLQRYDSPVLPDFQNAFLAFSNNQTVFIQPLNADYIAGYAPIKDVYGNSILVARIDMPRDIYKQGLSTINYFVLSLFGLTVVFVIAILLLMERTVLYRVVKLTSAVRNIGRNRDLKARVPTDGGDELSVLGKSINEMLADIEDKTLKLRKAEHLAAIGQLASMVGHDLRNPLTGITGATYYLKTRLDTKMNARAKEMVETIEKAIAHSDKIITDLLKYADVMTLKISEAKPGYILSKALSQIKVPSNIRVLDKTRKTQRIRCDQEKMETVFAKLVENAFEAMPHGGVLTVASAKVKEGVAVSFSDTGVGIPSEVITKLWSPFFTTKAKGMGLGLTICKRIVDAHGGRISVKSSVGRGSTFTITIPIHPKNQQEDSEISLPILEHPLSTLEKQSKYEEFKGI